MWESVPSAISINSQVGEASWTKFQLFFQFFFFRYQYYLQVKKEVLDGRLHCTVEQGIRLAGLAVQGNTKTHVCMRKHLMCVIYQRQTDNTREKECKSANSCFLRSSWLHYLIWLHTTVGAQSTWVPMVSALTHIHTTSVHLLCLTPGAVCISGGM